MGNTYNDNIEAKRVGITGQSGFIGSHLYNTLGLYPDKYERIYFDKAYFSSPEKLDGFVESCDVIVHLAALNRHAEQEVIYNTNIDLVSKLIDSLIRTKSQAHILMSSSSQEERDNLYGKSKRKGRELLSEWAANYKGKFTGLIIPNVFGAFGKPYYNSFIATFCHQLVHNETPNINKDAEIDLIYVQELVDCILKVIQDGKSNFSFRVEHTSTKKVSKVLEYLKKYKETYFDKGEIPKLHSTFELNLFNTFRSYIDYKNTFPINFTQHKDDRGSFVEIIRLGVGGQCSFSTTVPGVTRGNHYHTRKIERFAVIKGKALIQLRKIGTDEVMDFYLDGETPAYVDMPIWYTHNIKNIGDEILYTNFWINEPFNPEDSDTFYEVV